jgi:hypothetical protein
MVATPFVKTCALAVAAAPTASIALKQVLLVIPLSLIASTAIHAYFCISLLPLDHGIAGEWRPA